MQKLLAFFLAMLLSVSIIAGCGSNSPKTNDKQTTQTTTVNTTKSNNGQNTAANVKANSGKIKISQNAAYTDKEHVAAYINEYKRLPHNYITKNEAKKLGWQTKGTLDKVAPGKSIGGDRYGNYEGKLPKKNGRNWKECDIDYVKGNRNAKRIVFSNDGLIYYTGDHYKSFSKLYGK
ncbi:MAG: ribonuclease domain-containing protein [Phascolarctobacterium sp.]|uniref:ribonuclease domain-containing protein n=1 Tax=Phascolarctobacterium sp. TaxID=2049039 RepID=UPI003A10183F